MERYFDITRGGLCIRSKLYYDPAVPIEKVVLFGSGFSGHRDMKSAGKFAERMLAGYPGIAVLIFNPPCHLEDDTDYLRLPDCLTYLDTVLAYIREELGTEEIYSYTVSFSGYLVLNYLSLHGNPFRKITLRCPAVNMAEVLEGKVLTPEQLAAIRAGAVIEAGFEKKVPVNRDFLREVEQADVRQMDFSPFADDILIVQGTDDPVVPFEEGQRFAAKNGIRHAPVQGADHKFQTPEHMNAADKLALGFFGF